MKGKIMKNIKDFLTDFVNNAGIVFQSGGGGGKKIKSPDCNTVLSNEGKTLTGGKMIKRFINLVDSLLYR